MGATYRTFQADDGSPSVDGMGFNIGFDRRITETTRFRATAGLEDTDVINDESEVAWVANVSLFRQLETTTLLAQYRRSVSASGVGRLGARDSFNLNFTRNLTDKISAGLGARVYTTTALKDIGNNFDERNYVQLRSQFTWYLSENFSLEANYRYTFLDRESLGESSNSNQITLWLTWQPNPYIRSR